MHANAKQETQVTTDAASPPSSPSHPKPRQPQPSQLVNRRAVLCALVARRFRLGRVAWVAVAAPAAVLGETGLQGALELFFLVDVAASLAWPLS